MKSSTSQKTSTIQNLLVAVAFVSLLGSACITPALARDNNDREENGPQDNSHRDSGWHRGEHRNWQSDHRVRRDEYRQRDYYYRRYAEPIYAQPPVYYPPQQPPGISLFFPLDFGR